MKSKTLYNRKTFKKNLQRDYEEHTLEKNVDLYIYLNYVIFMKKLAQRSHEEAKKRQAESKKKKKVNILPQDIQQVSEQLLREFRG